MSWRSSGDCARFPTSDRGLRSANIHPLFGKLCFHIRLFSAVIVLLICFYFRGVAIFIRWRVEWVTGKPRSCGECRPERIHLGIDDRNTAAKIIDCGPSRLTGGYLPIPISLKPLSQLAGSPARQPRVEAGLVPRQPTLICLHLRLP